MMAKPRTNRVIAGRERGRAHIRERVNLLLQLPDIQESTVFVKVREKPMQNGRSGSRAVTTRQSGRLGAHVGATVILQGICRDEVCFH